MSSFERKKAALQEMGILEAFDGLFGIMYLR